MNIPIYQNSTVENKIRETTEIAKDIRSFLESATQTTNEITNEQECIVAGENEQCVYKSKMLKTRSDLNWEEHKYFIGVGLIMLFVAVVVGLLTMKLLR